MCSVCAPQDQYGSRRISTNKVLETMERGVQYQEKKLPVCDYDAETTVIDYRRILPFSKLDGAKRVSLNSHGLNGTEVPTLVMHDRH
jgi:hypothetical protein